MSYVLGKVEFERGPFYPSHRCGCTCGFHIEIVAPVPERPIRRKAKTLEVTKVGPKQYRLKRT